MGLTADRPPEGAGEAPQPLYPLGFGRDYTSFHTTGGQAVATEDGVTLRDTGEAAGTATFIVAASLPPAETLEAVRRLVGVVQAA